MEHRKQDVAIFSEILHTVSYLIAAKGELFDLINIQIEPVSVLLLNKSGFYLIIVGCYAEKIPVDIIKIAVEVKVNNAAAVKTK